MSKQGLHRPVNLLWGGRCGHCKKLAPEYEKAAGPLKKNEPPVTLISVDATQEDNKPLAEKYAIQGFPTLKVRSDIH